MTKVHNDLLLAMDNQKVSFIVALDLSAAFGTVDHNILKDVLVRQFGVAGLAHKWFVLTFNVDHKELRLITLYLIS